MEKLKARQKFTFEDLTEIIGVPDEDAGADILTTQELRNRLKHIAGLCYALSCDLKNVEIIAGGGNVPHRKGLKSEETVEQRERRLAYQRAYREKHKRVSEEQKT